MKNNYTHLVSGKKREGNLHEVKKQMRPRKETIDFLKLFARNYQADGSLPEGLQGFFVG